MTVLAPATDSQQAVEHVGGRERRSRGAIDAMAAAALVDVVAVIVRRRIHAAIDPEMKLLKNIENFARADQLAR